MNFIENAREFARWKHKGQVRRYTGEPYFNHVDEVADRVTLLTDDYAVIAAAYLHDTIEDTDTTYSELRDSFGVSVADLVFELTDEFTPGDFPAMNRAERKRFECRRYANVSNGAKLIKLCDIANNTSSIVEFDPKFAIVYLVEISELLKVIT